MTRLCMSLLMLIALAQTPTGLSSATSLAQIERNPTLTVLGPNGGERWVKGSTQTISWESENLTGSVKLVLVKGDTVFGEIEINAPVRGRYTWIVGDCPVSGKSAEPGRDYRIRVIAASDPSLRDDSNGPFRILSVQNQ